MSGSPDVPRAEIGYAAAFSFKYSRRPGTPATAMPATASTGVNVRAGSPRVTSTSRIPMDAAMPAAQVKHSKPAPYDLDRTLIEVEKQHIERVLRAEGGRVEAAARRLGIPRSSLYQRIKRHGIAVKKPD